MSVYLSKEWLELRNSIIKRDRGCCLSCGAKEKLCVHHCRYNTNGKGKKLIVSSRFLFTLCTQCHISFHKHVKSKEVYKYDSIQKIKKAINQKIDTPKYYNLSERDRKLQLLYDKLKKY